MNYHNTQEVQKEMSGLINVIELLPYAICITDPNGYPVLVNNNYIKLFGTTPPKDYNIFSDFQSKTSEFQDKLSAIKHGNAAKIQDIHYNWEDSNFKLIGKAIDTTVTILPITNAHGVIENFVITYNAHPFEEKATDIITPPTYTWQKNQNDFLLVSYNAAVDEITNKKISNCSNITASDIYKDNPDIINCLQECHRSKKTFMRELIHDGGGSKKKKLICYMHIPPDVVVVSIGEVEKEAQHPSDIKSLAATIAHELKNPLSLIRVAIYNIKKENPPSGILGHVKNIDKKISECDKIITNLLSYFRFKTPNYEDINIISLLEECIKEIECKYSDYDVQMEKHFNCNKDQIAEVDPVYIKSLFCNILDNGYQSFSSKKGTIKITALCDEKTGHLNFHFEDNGIGIDENDIPNIFNPFFTKRSKGLGLGLTVCDQVVRAHGGGINVKSTKGNGTTVSVVLPLKKI